MNSDVEEFLKRILAPLPGKPTSSALIAGERIAKLVGVEKWDKQIFYWADTIQVLQWGFPLNFFDEAALAHPFLSRLGRSILKTGVPNWNDFAEISGMALLVAHGASLPTPIPQTSGKSHDFIVNCGEHQIEVEVTRADTKQKHEEAKRLAIGVAERLHPLLSADDLVVHIRDIYDAEIRDEICEKSKSAPAILEREGIWSIRTCKVLREITELIRSGFEDDSPRWWPQSAVRMWCMRGMAAGPETQRAPPQVRVRFIVPIDGYLNSAMKKAKRFQGSMTRPFLIALDVTNLPKAFDVFRQNLNPLFSKWKHISGLLLFNNGVPINKIGWVRELLVNPYAARPLPQLLIDKFQPFGKPQEAFAFVTEDERIKFEAGQGLP